MASQAPKALSDSVMRITTQAPIRSVNLPESRVEEILDHLDKVEPQGGKSVDARRRTERKPFRHFDVQLSVLHPGGGVARFLIPTRDISSTGISILHGGYLHAGTDCKLELPTLWGGTTTVEGAVVRCDHLVGLIHLIAVMFYKPEDISEFVDTGSDEAPELIEMVDQPNLIGRILLVDDQPFEARLLGHHLRCCDVDIEHAPSAQAAREALRTKAIDVVICDMHLEEEGGEAAIRAFRDMGYKGPIIALSGEWSRKKLTAAREAGAAAILPKPYDPAKLMQNLASFLRTASGVDSDAVYSRLETDDVTRDLIRKFILDARKLAERLTTCIEAEDLAGARQVSLTLKEAGGGYGFPQLYEAAQQAITALDASFSVAESMQELRRLENVCARLQVKRT
ncbi:MAG: response regulator [Planctomycetota bacterium]|nr:MAG: response regulator [Planctomycetota bacterium]